MIFTITMPYVLGISYSFINNSNPLSLFDRPFKYIYIPTYLVKHYIFKKTKLGYENFIANSQNKGKKNE